MKCKDCFHFDICKAHGKEYKSKTIDVAKDCGSFKDKSKLVELRCNVGDTVYIADGWGERVQEFYVRKIGIFVEGIVLYYRGDYEQPITPDIWGKTVFLTREVAQERLTGWKGGSE